MAAGIWLAASAGGAARAGNYNIGEGYTAGPVNIAGYLNLVGENVRGGERQLVVDDISLFMGARLNRYLNPFFEAEFSGATLWKEHGHLLGDNHPRFVLERLYNDIHLTPELTLRAGKMLSPVGEWNSIHAAPLVPTVTRPLTTRRGFPEYTSGAALQYAPNDENKPEVNLYWQPGGELRPRPSEREYQDVAGVHLNWATGLTDKIGLSVQHARVRNTGDAQWLAGVNARQTLGRLQLETEATHIRISGVNPARVRDREWGAYLLGSYALDERWSVLARYEHFADRGVRSGSRNALAGISFRQQPSVVWKLEYVKQSGAVLDLRTGVQASLAVLF
ncbi:porin [Massilia solisilvae]|uniref:Porin n=1 Tax=Massilia solisilvae TaxID=1811225 RepID=A0ABT2BLZ6_9BURK|nr:porin [Massilia solisilvae]MCS0609536.1 porin [Massilia solisilvae]